MTYERPKVVVQSGIPIPRRRNRRSEWAADLGKLKKVGDSFAMYNQEEATRAAASIYELRQAGRLGKRDYIVRRTDDDGLVWRVWRVR